MTSNEIRTIYLGWTIGLTYILFFRQIIETLDTAHDALLQSPMPNVTSIKIGSVCGIPYDDCRCSVQTAKNVFLEDCLTDRFLLYSRIFLQVSFILQFYFVREVFTVSGKYSSIVIYCLWITAALIFVFIANGIYHPNSCFHRGIHFFLFVTNSILFVFAGHGLIRLKDMTDSQSRHSNNTNDTASEEITGDKASEEIIDDEASEESTDDETFDEITNKPIVWENLL